MRSGETVTTVKNPAEKPLDGFEESKPVVFSSLFPISSEDYNDLAVAMDKLKLNDASLTFEKVNSVGLGFGFRCGFLGLLHLEVIQEGSSASRNEPGSHRPYRSLQNYTQQR